MLLENSSLPGFFFFFFLKASVRNVLIFNPNNLEELEATIRQPWPSVVSSRTRIYLITWKEKRDCQSPIDLFLNKACTVSAEGDPGGEGGTPDSAHATSASKGGRRKGWRLPL